MSPKIIKSYVSKRTGGGLVVKKKAQRNYCLLIQGLVNSFLEFTSTSLLGIYM